MMRTSKTRGSILLALIIACGSDPVPDEPIPEPDAPSAPLPDLAADEFRLRVCETLVDSVFDNDVGDDLRLDHVDQPSDAEVEWDESGEIEVTIPETAADDDVVAFAYTATTTNGADAGGAAVIITVENKPLRRIRNGEIQLGAMDQGGDGLRVADGRAALLDNFDDPDAIDDCGAPVFAQTEMVTEQGGTVSIDEDGSVHYTPPDELFWGTDRFTFEVSDPATPEEPLEETAEISVRPRLVTDAASGLFSFDAPREQALGAALSSVTRSDDAQRQGDCTDLALGAPAADDGAGRVYVLRGCQDKTGATNLASLPAERGFVIRGAAGDGLGASLADLGDLDGDGYGDLAIGAPGDEQAPGRVYVVFGGQEPLEDLDLGDLAASSESLDRVLVLEGGREQTCALDAGERAGRRLAVVADLDGGGAADLAVSIDFPAASDDAPTSRGGVQVVFGEELRQARRDFSCGGRDELSLLGEQPGLLLEGSDSEELFGDRLAGAADLDGDARPELVIGSKRRALVLPWSNELLNGGEASSFSQAQLLEQGCGETATLSILDDLSGDQHADLLVCSCEAEAECFISFGAGFTRDQDGESLPLGAWAMPALDVSGDELREVIVTAGHRARIAYGEPAAPVASQTTRAPDEADRDARAETNVETGIDAAVDAAVDGDAGLMLSGDATPTSVAVPAFGSEVSDGRLGFAVELSNPIAALLAPGDVDGDGIGDLLFGLPQAGRVYLLSGGRFSAATE